MLYLIKSDDYAKVRYTSTFEILDQTSTVGYTTIRILSSDLSDATIDSYLENLK